MRCVYGVLGVVGHWILTSWCIGELVLGLCYHGMERLNSLERSLPPEQPPTEKAIATLNSELSQEFKLAANSVTKLYRLANERASLVRHQGYLDCVEDVLSLIDGSTGSKDSNGSNGSKDPTVEDIREWCLKRRQEMLSSKDGRVDSHRSDGRGGQGRVAPKVDFHLQKSFLGKTEVPQGGKIEVPTFKLGKPPLSVEHHARPGRRRQLNTPAATNTTFTSTPNNENSEMHESVPKKPKL